MPLTLLSGPVNSGKTTKLMQLLADRMHEGPCFYISPFESIANQLRQAFLKQLSDQQNQSALIGDIFTSYNNFLSITAHPDKKPISNFQQKLLCHSLLKKQKLDYFYQNALSLSISAEAAQSIQVLKQNGISPDTLESLLKTRSSLREKDFLQLYKNYEETLDQLTLLDPGSIYQLALEKVINNELSEIPQTICFDEFFLPSPGLFSFVKALKNTLHDTEIYISAPCANHPEQLFAKISQQAINQLKVIADKHIALNNSNPSEANTSVLALRNPLAETRLVAQEVLGNQGDHSIHTCLCTRQNSNFAKECLTELQHLDKRAKLARIENSISAPIIRELFSDKNMPQKATIEQFSLLINTSLENANTINVCHTKLANPSERLFISRAIADTTLLREAIHELSADADTFNVGIISQDDYVNLLEELLNSKKKHRPSIFGAFALELANFEHASSQFVDRLIIPELTQGNIPREKNTRIFFSQTNETETLINTVLAQIFPELEVSIATDAYIFHTWISKTNHEVILTHSISNNSGTEMASSSLINEFGQATLVDAPLLLASEANDSAKKQAIQQKIRIELERQNQQFNKPEYHGQITDQQAKQLISKRYNNETFSPSKLERYAECPFLFYIEKVLNLNLDSEAEKEIQPKDKGTIIHNVLESFYSEHSTNNSEQELKQTIAKITRAVFEQHKKLLVDTAAQLHPFELRDIEAAVLQIIKLENAQLNTLEKPLSPFVNEWSFGNSAENALKIKTDNSADILLQGKVDRIDTSSSKDEFIITDYKTGKTVDSVRKKIATGKHLQLPLYIEAVRQLLLPNSNPLGGILVDVAKAEKKHGLLKKDFNEKCFSMSSRSHSLVETDEWDNAINQAIESTKQYVQSIRAGNFQTQLERCKYCANGDICRVRK